jgi:site-specific DNA recombinase
VAMNPTIAGLRADLDGDDPSALIAGGWKAIITPDRWNDVIKVLTDPRRRTSTNAPPSLLSGHLICGGIGKDGKPCGAMLRPFMHKASAHGRNGVGVGERRRYRCQVSNAHPHACQGNSIDLKPIEDYVTEQLLRTLDSSIAEIGPIEINDVDDLDDITARLDELAGDWAAGVITRSEWRAARAVLDQRLNDAERTTRRQRNSQSNELMSAHDVRDAWELLDNDEQRAVVRDLLAPIVLVPTHGRRLVPIEERVSVTLAAD